MNRREFIQRGLALGATLSLGVRLPGWDEEQVIEIVDFEIGDDYFSRCLKLGRTTFKDGVFGMEVAFDMESALDATYCIDANGNRYPYRVIEQVVEAGQSAGFETIDGKWWAFLNGEKHHALTDDEASRVIWGLD